MINNQTRLFTSFSAAPGNFGATVFNELFRKHGINAIYLPRSATSAQQVAESFKNLSIAGSAISTPLKTKIIPFLDELDPIATATQSVNTVLKDGTHLRGFNTDVAGILGALKGLSFSSVLIYGSGSVTQSIVFALRQMNPEMNSEIYLTGRNKKVSLELATRLQIQSTNPSRFDLLINATPITRRSQGEELFNLLKQSRIAFDLPVSIQESEFIQTARKLGIQSVAGLEMAKHQLVGQFELYTRRKIKVSDIETILEQSPGI